MGVVCAYLWYVWVVVCWWLLVVLLFCGFGQVGCFRLMGLFVICLFVVLLFGLGFVLSVLCLVCRFVVVSGSCFVICWLLLWLGFVCLLSELIWLVVGCV